MNTRSTRQKKMAEGKGGAALTLIAIQDILVKEIQKVGDE